PDRGRNGAKVVETANVVTAGYQDGCATFRGQDEARPQHVTRVTHVRTQRTTDVPYIGSRNLYPRGSMPRTLLAGLALIALAACGGGHHHGRERAQASARTPVAAKPTATKAGAPAKRKGAAKPDTAGQRNPLVNHSPSDACRARRRRTGPAPRRGARPYPSSRCVTRSRFPPSLSDVRVFADPRSSRHHPT